MNPIENKYYKTYVRLIESRRLMKRDGYLEAHHIIPRSLGGSNEISNVINLTAREHLITHLLLPRFLLGSEKWKMCFALNFLVHGNKKHRKIALTARQYQYVKEQTTLANKSYPRPSMTAETKKKISEGNKGKLLGRKISDERKEKIKTGMTAEVRSVIREKAIGRKRSQESIEKSAASHRGSKRNPRSEQWSILQRVAHLGRKDQPETRAKKSLAQSGENNPRAKVWVLEREDGSFFEVKSLKSWCRENQNSFDWLTSKIRKNNKFRNGVRLQTR